MKTLVFLILIPATFLILSNSPSFAQEETPSPDSIREKVEEKVQAALSNPKAIIGAITDITDTTLQVKDELGEINQVSMNKDSTDVVKVDKTSKNIKIEDLGIGDFIVAMGFKNETNVLDAKRILVTAALEAPNRQIHLGEVVGIENKVLTLKTSEGEFEIAFPKTWKGPEIKEIVENDKAIVVSEKVEEKLNLRTIEILSPASSPISEEE